MSSNISATRFEVLITLEHPLDMCEKMVIKTLEEIRIKYKCSQMTSQSV